MTLQTSFVPGLKCVRRNGCDEAMRPLILLTLCLSLSACSGPLKLLTGGGPNVAANVQAGAENNQTIGSSTSNDQKIIRPQARTIEQSAGQTGVRSEKVETVVVEAASDWFWILMTGIMLGWFMGWVTETPREMIRGFKK